jgi:regulatory protein RepA
MTIHNPIKMTSHQPNGSVTGGHVAGDPPTSSPEPVELMNLAGVWTAKPDDLDFVLPGFLIGTIGILVAPGGTGKSVLALTTALSVCIGRDLGNIWGKAPSPGGVVYLCLEDPETVLRHRLWTLSKLVLEEDRAKAIERLLLIPGAGVGYTIAELKSPGRPSPWFEEFTSWVQKRKPRLIIIDTLNRFLGGISEIDSSAIGVILAAIESLCRTAGCSVLICHHTNKFSMMNSAGSEAFAARGSSALTDNARWQANLMTMPQFNADTFGFNDTERRNWIRLDIAKQNYGPQIEERWLHRDKEGILQASKPSAKKHVIRATKENDF